LRSLTEAFNDVYRNRSWGDEESLSGLGSTQLFANSFLTNLEGIIRQYDVTSIADLSCGDCNWIRQIFGKVDYCGYDVSDLIIKINRTKYEDCRTSFRHLEILEALKRPKLHELCIIRHTFEHLPTSYVTECLSLLKFKTKFALITSANYHDGKPEEIDFGANSREINLLKSPFFDILGLPAQTFWDTIGTRSDRGCFGHLYQFC
jgi:hypothetical protein